MDSGVPQDILKRLLEARNIPTDTTAGAAAYARLLEVKEDRPALRADTVSRILRLTVRETAPGAPTQP